LLASGSRDQTAVIWNWLTQTKVKTFQHSEEVTALLKINDTVLATGGLTIKLWDINTGTMLTMAIGHGSVSVSKMLKIDNQRFASIAYGNTQCKVWSIDNGQLIVDLGVNNLDSSPISIATLIQIDSESIAIGTRGDYERIVIWSTIDWTLRHNISNGGDALTLIQLKDGRLASRTCCTCFNLITISPFSKIQFYPIDGGDVQILKELPDGSVLSGVNNGNLSRNFLSSNTSQILQQHTATVNHIELISSNLALSI
jgi:hypothetical protein